MADKTTRMSAAEYQASQGKPRTRQPAPVALAKPAKASGLPSYSFTYSGPGLSSNKWYAGIRWTARIALKKTWAAKLAPLIAAAGFQHMERFTANLRYRSKIDADNTTAMLKLLCDQIKGVYVPDDSPKYFKGFSVDYDDTLPNNTFIFTISALP